MMKIMILLLSLIPTLCFAEGIEYDCKKSGKVQECIMYATSNFEVSAIEYHLNGNIKNFEATNDFLGDYENNKILLYTDTFKKGKFEIGKITYTGKIKSTYLSYGDNEFNEVIIYNKEENKINYYLFIVPIVILVLLIALIRRRKKYER